MRIHRQILRPLLCIALLALAGCGGGDSGSNGGTPTPITYTVGGTVTGLSGSLVLQLNGGNNLTVSAAGAFTFASTPLASAANYAVTVLTQPATQTCTAASGSGTIGSANVTNVAITCVNIPTYSVTANVSGLAGTVVLQLNGGSNLSVSTSGNATFTTQLINAAAYAVTVLTQPAGQSCTVGNGTGTIAAANVSNVTVACVSAYTVGGTVSGLTASGLKLTLLNNSTATSTQLEELIVGSGATTFTFATTFTAATSVGVVIKDANQPTGLTCVLGNAGNQAGTANVTVIQVACATKTTTAVHGTYRVGLPNDGHRSYFTFFANGSYTFSAHDNDVTVQTDVEHGIYNWNSTTGVFTAPVIMVDTNDMGLTGLHDGSSTMNVVASGGNLVATVHETGFPDEVVTLYPVTNTSGSLVGVWSGDYPRDAIIYLADGTFMATITGLNKSLNALNSPALYNGLEDGCYTAAAGTLAHTVVGCVLDTTGQPGINANGNVGVINNTNTQTTFSYAVSGDTLTRTNNSGTPVTITFTRVQ